MTKKIPLNEVQEIFDQCEQNSEGWVRTIPFLKKITEKTGCSMPTAYRIMNANPDFFEVSHGKIRKKKQIVEDDLNFLDWIGLKNKLLDKAVEFLKTQPMTPKVETLLVKIGFVRDELKSGVDNGLEELKILLEQDYGFKLDEGGVI